MGPDSEFIRGLKTVSSYTGCDREEYHGPYSKGVAFSPETVLYKGTKLPFTDNRFNTVLSLDCIEHIAPTEIPEYLQELRRVLKDKGRLILMAPFTYAEHCTPHDYQRFSRFGLAKLLNDAGFTLVSTTSRSSTMESLIFLFNHRYFSHAFPRIIAGEFVSPGHTGKAADILKFLLLPFTIPVYVSLALLLVLQSSVLPATRREKSPLSLGYTVVGERR